MDHRSNSERHATSPVSQVPAPPSAAGRRTTNHLRFPGDDGGRSLQEAARRDLEVALQLLAERAQYITGASGAAIALREGDAMVCRASAGSTAPELDSELQVNSGLSGESIRAQKTLVCDDAERDVRVNRESCRELGVRSVIVIPLLREGNVAGVFELLAVRSHAFESRDIMALERLSEMILTAMDHAEAATRSLPDLPPPPSENTVTMSESADRKENSPPPESNDAPPVIMKGVPDPASDKSSDKIGKCLSCGFPVSGGRVICLDCEKAQMAEGGHGADQEPAFLSQLSAQSGESWLSSHLYTIGTLLVVILTVVLIVLKFR